MSHHLQIERLLEASRRIDPVFLHTHAGAAGLAVPFQYDHLKGRRVAAVLCGSNLTPAQMEAWL
ncbi:MULTISPECIES: hypothetical protein [Meiothermus]|jgi:threonine dehydratase|uniref:Uncharacterized protein n=1 Tax=Meiothermus ruber (strain ATCC 35948 / DSM 1279 / VKM B-1258 / 21) TaxID=504728 RepID=D3PKA7_MEIRD|nr:MULTISPECIES: hypothetical protein [Meiothermus]GIW39159.1 MAG: hypothetical protein KatS3mg075_640 [Meiothermus sp.]ADD26788.1 hypothetical protein Mrub_0006 [Meiothermus ruber DSM 1279]AGK04738.1 hypothetical protein K649_07200 [Meiothermus ruber DSM 1279]KIQ53467.1 hypothetical protein SY28_13725 [Meiothermus taiwanensis]GAO73700.1 putative uncharacterized protein [Meiothermus ruber H328]